MGTGSKKRWKDPGWVIVGGWVDGLESMGKNGRNEGAMWGKVAS